MAEPAEVPMLNPTELCSRCDFAFSSNIYNQKISDEFSSMWFCFKYHDTLAELRDAALKRGCFICFRVWKGSCISHSSTMGCFNIVFHRNENISPILVPLSGSFENSIAFALSNTRLSNTLTAFNPNPAFTERLSLTRAWLRECTLEHEKCDQGRSAEDFLPSRLLDIGASNDQWTLRTAEDVKKEPHQRYVALSYKWGDYRQNFLTESTYPSFEAGISSSKIPILFKDTASVSRFMGIRYLWIDSMCILQDSTEDWERESEAMCDIYANAEFVVSASWAKDPTCSLFPENNMGPRRGSTSLSTTWKGRETISIEQIEGWMQHLKESPLTYRAWAFQERLLAPRILHFTENTILWECDTMQRSESFPQGEFQKPYSIYRLHTWTSTEQERNHFLKHDSMSNRLLVAWKKMIEEYSCCQLTLPKDRLIAVGGIAELFQKFSGDEYIAGLWKSRIFDCLVWGCSYFSPCEEYRAPSWSWASIEGGIIWLITPNDSKHWIVYPCSLLDTHIVTHSSTGSPRGQILDGYITISGHALTYEPEKEACSLETFYERKFGIKGLHRSRDILQDNAVYFLILKLFQPQSHIWNFVGIALQKLPKRDLFVRVGSFGVISDAADWVNWEKVFSDFGLTREDNRMPQNKGWLVVDEKAEQRTYKII